MRKGNPEKLTGLKISPDDIEGYLIAYKYQDNAIVEAQMDRLEDAGIHCVKWYDLLQAAEDEQRKFLDIVKRKAPKDDPRIKELEEKKLI